MTKKKKGKEEKGKGMDRGNFPAFPAFLRR